MRTQSTKPGLNTQIYELVKLVPVGKVATYGQIAALIGRCTARQVGFAMAATPPNQGIPWQRVINSQGKISPHGGGEGSGMQRVLLEQEGIEFSKAGRVDFRRFGWDPDGLDMEGEFDERTLF